ncbi:MetQ/NlpA family ABC transporter substrate-binding protein [Sporosarcina sp. ACRSM]|uniref:MetQ/NlpA family ABC transporter substrate-binding protein n=1 Tax=Sporosarcina sp. ACRSM TaxID=2918216 RepID=UPI001EF4802B|nr:MetQ/NlpA family ABC transporter substrate-binding protein [Sporosarcina sp. ACRSM]MCG7336041.1 MetQ/NlpA family ABC transporter substrate-binding protein [Sporosarcina sp. ACRSM]
MKKILFGLLLAVLLLALAACGTKNDTNENSTNGSSGEEATGGELTKLVVGASNTPHAIILEKAAPLLEEKGIELDIQKYQDYILPNQDLESEDLDANYFQHIPYLDLQIKDHGYKFVNAGGIHIEPIGIYSKEYKSLEELPDGATVLISNSVADHGRVLALLEAKGLIKLAEGIDKTSAELKDIAENPKNLQFDAKNDPAILPQFFNNGEGDIVLINTNFAIDAGLNPLEDAIAMEDSESPYVNIIAVREGDENKPEIKTLVEVLQSQEIQDFIVEEWNGEIVPVK